MAYYLEREEGLSEGVRRIALEQNHMAIDALADDEDPHGGVHKARKHFKKLRALYRLVRDELGHKAYRQGNVFYRDMGRRLAGLRDITSLMEAASLLKEQPGAEAEAFAPLLALLEKEREAILQAQVGEDNLIEEAILQLRQNRGRILQLLLRDDCLPKIITGIHRVYLRGRRAYKKAMGNPSVEDMHEWRKRVKYIWYHYRLLRQAWPRVFRAYKKSAKELSDILGDYHDLALLDVKVEQCSGELAEDVRRILLAASREQQDKLLREARRLGGLLYAEPPKLFARRMRSILEGNLL